MYFDQLLLTARKVHVVNLDQLLGAAHYIHFISNQDTSLSQHLTTFTTTKTAILIDERLKL